MACALYAAADERVSTGSQMRYAPQPRMSAAVHLQVLSRHARPFKRADRRAAEGARRIENGQRQWIGAA